MPGRRWKFKETEEQKCHRKLRHTNYPTALMHARSLGVDAMDIYPCDLCGGLHLGHTTLKYAAHCKREHKAKISRLISKIETHEQLISQHTAIIHRLRRKLEVAMSSCSGFDAQDSD